MTENPAPGREKGLRAGAGFRFCPQGNIKTGAGGLSRECRRIVKSLYEWRTFRVRAHSAEIFSAKSCMQNARFRNRPFSLADVFGLIAFCGIRQNGARILSAGHLA